MPRPNPKRIEGQFVPHRMDMLESDAWRSLSPAARGILDRLEIEHMAHGGGENGNLPCTYDDFAAYGVRRKSISTALAELVTTGFIVVAHVGRGGNGQWRDPSRYRLTYLSSPRAAPSDEWRRFIPSRTKAAAGASVEQEA